MIKSSKLTRNYTKRTATNASPDANGHVMKRCDACYAQLTISNFGFNKTKPDGRHIDCLDCRSEYQAIKYAETHGRSALSKDRPIQRIVRFQNATILYLGFNNGPFNCIGFTPHTSSTYQIYIGPSLSIKGMQSIRVVDDLTSNVIMDFAFEKSIDQAFLIRHFIALFKGMQLRLEASEADMLYSKQTIYYLD